MGPTGYHRKPIALGWLTVICVATSLGCYKYTPATLDAVPTGEKVRALLSSEAEAELRSRVGLASGLVEGELLEKNDDSVLLSVRATGGSQQLGTQSLYQRIDVARQDVLRVDVRRLDAPRTAVAAGGLTGAAVVALVVAIGEGKAGGPDIPNGEPPESRRRFLLGVPVLPW
jgi:hypothetical protein